MSSARGDDAGWDPDDNHWTRKLLVAFTQFVVVVPLLVVLAWLLWCFGDVSGFGTKWGTPTHDWIVFNFHPLLMTLGFGCVFSQALVSFRVLPFSWKARKRVHMCLQVFALLTTTMGLVTVRVFKDKIGAKSWYTTHAWVGLATYVLFALQCTLGLLFLWRPALFLAVFPAHEHVFRTVLPWHVMAGLSIYLLATVAIITGVLNRQWLYRVANDIEVYEYGDMYMVGNLVAFSVVILALTVYYWHRNVKKPDSRTSTLHYLALDT